MIISWEYLQKSPEGGNNATPQAFAFIFYRSGVARSDHGECKDVKNDVRPDAQRKDRATANHESAWPNDDLGADGHGVRCVPRQLRWIDVALIRVKNSKAARGDLDGFAFVGIRQANSALTGHGHEFTAKRATRHRISG
jgi:hypothetical protein